MTTVVAGQVHGGAVYTSFTFDPVNQRFFWQENLSTDWWLNAVDVKTGAVTSIAIPIDMSGMQYDYVVPEPATLGLLVLGCLALLRRRTASS